MTLDEAIELYEEGSKETWNGHQTRHGEASQQIAEWLKELKRYKEAQVTDAVDRVTIKEYLESFGNIKTEKEPCEDAISRQAVEDTIINYRWKYSALYESIKQLPPVTPQPKMGHWITTRTIMHDGEYYCDKCKCDAPNNKKWDYCPNCGLCMHEVEG